MCACATTEKALCSPSFKECCYESMPAARCYSGSRDQVEKREYISVNGKAAFPVYRRCGDFGG